MFRDDGVIVPDHPTSCSRQGDKYNLASLAPRRLSFPHDAQIGVSINNTNCPQHVVAPGPTDDSSYYYMIHTNELSKVFGSADSHRPEDGAALPHHLVSTSCTTFNNTSTHRSDGTSELMVIRPGHPTRPLATGRLQEHEVRENFLMNLRPCYRHFLLIWGIMCRANLLVAFYRRRRRPRTGRGTTVIWWSLELITRLNCTVVVGIYFLSSRS